ncbi:hypothetical protein [Paenibacillus sp. MER 78]|uniref:hypothetical protein n=1 Tax=Paenibacillus sp. MER 78 TaxID=2939571 RepID=UPI0020423C8A|nr:hypothetical protein [Paenibacillus sp. MER 78]MCM3128132.1 hypothetical protein [Paenibacillus sp. MER 78]
MPKIAEQKSQKAFRLVKNWNVLRQKRQADLVVSCFGSKTHPNSQGLALSSGR